MGKYYSDELEKGIELLYFQTDSSKYAEGVRLMERACENKEPDAFYFMARCYAWGNGNVNCNDAKAVEYSRQGAALGSDLCIIGADRFGELKKLEGYMQHSLQEAVDAVKEMALAGNPMAQYAVGLFYYWGDAISIQGWSTKEELDELEKVNGPEGVRWFKMAARQGCIPAFQNVYISTRNGSNGVPKDVRAALAFAEEMRDMAPIPVDMYDMIGNDYENEKNTAKQIEWYERGIEAGNRNCINNLGMVYLDDKSGYTDEQRAVALFMKGVDANEPYSMHNLGRCYFYGWGVEEDQKKAFGLFEKAAAQNVANSQFLLGRYYEEGLGGIKKDKKKADFYYQQAKANGHSRAAEKLAGTKKGGGSFGGFLTYAGAILLVAALMAGISGWNQRRVLPAAADLEDMGVHTFRPYQVLPYSVKNTGNTRNRRTNPTRTVYMVTYNADDGSGYRFRYKVSSQSEGQELIAENKVVERKVLYNKKEEKQLYIEAGQSIDEYVAEQKKQSNGKLLLCIAYVIFYAACFMAVKTCFREKGKKKRA